MSELDLTKRVRELHTSVQDPTVHHVAPGECPCDSCTETMGILSSLDGLPDKHLMKVRESGFSMEHPLACRVELEQRGLTLHDCEMHMQVSAIFHAGEQTKLAENTYEVEFRDGEIKVHGKGDSTWYPLRHQHDPTSESFRSRPGH